MSKYLDLAARYKKAIIGFFAPGIVILGAPLTQGHAPAASDWYTALGAVLVTAFGVGLARNRGES